MAAFERAAALGVDWIELDVQTCGSGEVVVIHDPDLGRLGGRPDAVVAELPLRVLQALDVGSHFGPEHAGERVPTLAEVIDAFGDRVGLHVEVKEYGLRGDGTAARTAALLARRASASRVLVTSYNPFALARVARAAPDLPRGLIHPPEGGVAGLRRTLRDRLFRDPWSAGILGAAALLPRWGQLDGASLREARRRERRLIPWVLDDEEDLLCAVALGLDGVLTNRPDRALRSRAARRPTPLDPRGV